MSVCLWNNDSAERNGKRIQSPSYMNINHLDNLWIYCWTYYKKSWLWKKSVFNLISQQPYIDKIYLCAKGPYEAKFQFLTNKRENKGLKHFKSFIEYSNDMNDIYENIEEYNRNKKRKIFIVFDDMITDILNIKKRNPIITELFIRGRKLNISLVFITEFYFAVPKTIRLTISLRKFQTNKNFNKLYLIIHQILTLKTLWIFIKCTESLMYYTLLRQIIL